ncbi:F-box/WD repeat-containing protein 7-like [Branchiostoma lanceolatum]|uniref:F-box/WD repeat-containing protein 7-like n=1 Tax=Branchiostoma lanceolatum TaxID=7740 RepID=UPI003453FA1C
MDVAAGGDDYASGGASDSDGPTVQSPKRAKSRSKVWDKVTWFARRKSSRGCSQSEAAGTPHPGAACLPDDRMDVDSTPSSPRALSECSSSSEGDLSMAESHVRQTNPNSQVDSQSCIKPSVARALFHEIEMVSLATRKPKIVIQRRKTLSSQSSEESDSGNLYPRPTSYLDSLHPSVTNSSAKCCHDDQNLNSGHDHQYRASFSCRLHSHCPSARNVPRSAVGQTPHCLHVGNKRTASRSPSPKPRRGDQLDAAKKTHSRKRSNDGRCCVWTPDSVHSLGACGVDGTGSRPRSPSPRMGQSSRLVRDVPLSPHLGESRRQLGEGVDGPEFKKRMELMMDWFGDFNDQQKNIIIKRILDQCGLPQMHLLSVAMEPILHQTCPHNCQDLLAWLPASISIYILSFLDPVSLTRASQTSRVWYELANEPCLWRRFCTLPTWQMSRNTAQKQMINHMLPDGTIHWKKVFGERYCLRRNWLQGTCTVKTFDGHTQGISCVVFDDTRIVSGSSDKTIKVWNIRTNTPWSVLTLAGHSGTVRCLHLEGNTLVSGATDRTIKVWDLSMQSSWSSIACRVTMIGHSDTVRCLKVDEERVVSGSYDQTLKVWNLRTGHCKHTLRGHTAAVLCVQFDDNKIVSGSADNTIKIWNIDGECLKTLIGHMDAVTCLNFTGDKIVSGSLDSDLKFWDMRTGQCVSTLDWTRSEGHTGVIRCLQADHWRIVSAADDKTLKVWSVEDGKRLVTLRNHTDGVTCLQFNDYMIVSGSYDKTVKLWDFSVSSDKV